MSNDQIPAQCETVRRRAEDNSASIRRLSIAMLITTIALLTHVVAGILQEVL